MWHELRLQLGGASFVQHATAALWPVPALLWHWLCAARIGRSLASACSAVALALCSTHRPLFGLCLLCCGTGFVQHASATLWPVPALLWHWLCAARNGHSLACACSAVALALCSTHRPLFGQCLLCCGTGFVQHASAALWPVPALLWHWLCAARNGRSLASACSAVALALRCSWWLLCGP